MFQGQSQSAFLGRKVRQTPIQVGLRGKSTLNFLSSLVQLSGCIHNSLPEAGIDPVPQTGVHEILF